VFLDKAIKGGWVLLARQHGVSLADLTPLQPLFERLERPALALNHTWPTPQADEAVVQVRAAHGTRIFEFLQAAEPILMLNVESWRCAHVLAATANFFSTLNAGVQPARTARVGCGCPTTKWLW
jgi:hypothetical protein